MFRLHLEMPLEKRGIFSYYWELPIIWQFVFTGWNGSQCVMFPQQSWKPKD